MIRSIARSTTLRIIGIRILQAVPVMWGVTFLTFVLMNLLPGDEVSALLGTTATPATIRALTLKLHLNEPFFVRYWHWLLSAVQGHLGSSLSTQEAVSTVIVQRLPVTLELVGIAFFLSIIFTIPVALLGARRPGGIIDRLNMMISMFGLSIPNFVLALLLIILFSVKLGLLPAVGFTAIDQSFVGNIKSMILPASSLAFGLFCGYTRVLRADIAEQMTSEDYILLARGKGVRPSLVLIRHALRNSLFGLLTLIGLNLGTLIGGTVIIESIFGIPGIGQVLVYSIGIRDVTTIEGIVTVLAIAVVLSNLLTDLLYTVLDPRIRYGRSDT